MKRDPKSPKKTKTQAKYILFGVQIPKHIRIKIGRKCVISSYAY